ncbi:MAG: PrsW family glutamic-type intramembrane protease [Atopobiaceae bacterium]|nr:PrsW family glutamic-type intramembrane protease [Atopobiaceae bacterium]
MSNVLVYVPPVLSVGLCTFFFVRAYRREVPEPMKPWWRIVIPVALGLVAPWLSTGLAILFSGGVKKLLGVSILQLTPNVYANSLLGAFLLAGFTEEFVKFIFILIAIKIVKPAKVYEYVLIGMAVGLGFCIMEEYLYSGGEEGEFFIVLVRLPLFAMHMVLDAIMGLGLGMHKYCKQTGRPGAKRWLRLGLILPVLWHTLYDSATVKNPLILAPDDPSIQTVALVYAGIMMVGSIVLEFTILMQLKKNAERSCALPIV